MSRDSSGTMTLLVAAKVPLNTLTSSDWNSLWNDMKTEMTASLNRSGKGGMLAPLELQDGTKTLPGWSFISDTDTGAYLAGAGDMRFTVADTDVLNLAAAGVTVPGTLTSTGVLTASVASTLTGTVTGPSGSWSSSGLDLASGDSFFVNSNNVLSQTALGSTVLASSLTSVGTLTSLATSGAIESGGDITFASGGNRPLVRDIGATIAVPTLIPYESDPDTGISGSNANTGWLIAGGIASLSWESAEVAVLLATDATSSTAASLKTAGGIASAKALWVGTTSRLVGAVTCDSSVTTSASFVMTGPAALIGTYSASSGAAVDINADSLTVGSVASFASNSAAPNTRDLVSIHNDHTSATGATCLTLIQDADSSFMGFTGTAGASTSNPISTHATAGSQYGWGQVLVNGSKKWIKFYEDPSA